MAIRNNKLVLVVSLQTIALLTGLAAFLLQV